MTEVHKFWLSVLGTVLGAAIIGGTIWGVQLNATVLVQSQQIGALTTLTERNHQNLTTLGNQMVRITAILDTLEKRVARDETILQNHLAESEDWKQRIRLNEERTK